MNDFYITGTRRGLGEALNKFYDTVDTLEECDVFINCKHDGFQQVELLYEAAELDKRIINIGSNSPDGNKSWRHPYAGTKGCTRQSKRTIILSWSRYHDYKIWSF